MVKRKLTLQNEQKKKAKDCKFSEQELKEFVQLQNHVQDVLFRFNDEREREILSFRFGLSTEDGLPRTREEVLEHFNIDADYLKSLTKKALYSGASHIHPFRPRRRISDYIDVGEDK